MAVFVWLKVGMGFILNSKSYMRDPWNILDFIIIVSGYLPYMMQSSSGVNLTSLRSLRILRPLRTISSVKNLKNILITLFAAIPLMINTIIILIFFLMVFGIAGLQLYMGLLKKKCFNSQTGVMAVDYQTQPFCQSDSSCNKYNTAAEFYICGKMIDNPNSGVTNFDNFASAYLQVFQIITLEGWSDIMYAVMDTFNVGISARRLPLRLHPAPAILAWALPQVTACLSGGLAGAPPRLAARRASRASLAASSCGAACELSSELIFIKQFDIMH